MHYNGADYSELASRVLNKDERALARLISLVEEEPAHMSKVLPLIQSSLGSAYCIGFTGPPGAGKSSLVNQVISSLRERGYQLGIIAVDPSSPFSGGALLGDRIRMQKHYTDPGVFIRSMATRGSYGGLARATRDVAKLMDAFGVDFILIETVGVGQTEMDIMQSTDTTVVTLVPEGGDSVQAMKAGLMEIGDVFVVNKCDRPGSEDIAMQLKVILQMNARYAKNMPPILLTQSLDGTGIDELINTLLQQKMNMEKTNELEKRRKARRKAEFEETLKNIMMNEWSNLLADNKKVMSKLKEAIEGDKDPYSAIWEIFPDGII